MISRCKIENSIGRICMDGNNGIGVIFIQFNEVSQIQSVVAYSFTPYGFADEKLTILSSEQVETGLLFAIPKKQTKRKAIQFIAQNKPITYSIYRVSRCSFRFDIQPQVISCSSEFTKIGGQMFTRICWPSIVLSQNDR